MRETFILPDFKPLLDVSGVNCDKVVVVSIVGKTPCNSMGLKVKSVGRVFTAGCKTSEECFIEGCYDEENQIIYLHLHSLLDTDLLIKRYESLVERCNNERKCDDFLVINDEIKSSFARALLLLIHISHIVILSHPGWTFDTSYIQYFKAVDNLSQKKVNKITEALKEIEGLSPDWISNGRLCTPRFIFYFERCPKGIYNLKKVEHNLEDRIYHILKKTRIISSFGSSLFAIPMNEEFVFISSEQSRDRLGEAVRGLIQDCQPGGVMQVQAPFCSQPYSERHFLKFLQVHIKQARSKGFNDTGSSSRHQLTQPTHFELPTLQHWIDSTKVIYDVIMKKGLISSLCTDTRFSEQRCLKVLPLALARYQENLPPHYPHAEHDRRLSMALALFNAQARGPVFQQYVTKLKADCKAHWENGRQQCEAASMTGNPCKLPKHTSEQEHMSGFIYKAICDCGRKIGPREDPYNAKQANYLFYQQISRECICSKLERISFPVFQPSIKEYKAATLKETEEALSVLSDRSNELTPENERGLFRQPSTTEYLPGMLTLSSPPGLLPVYSSWSLVCLGPSSLYSHNLGLSESHHPGFLNSTNYLLPWDVTVYSKAKMNWVSKYSARGRRGRPAGASPQYSVKVFIGVEYECSSGHRFMLAAPDKILKATPGSIVKDTGHKIAESDMPLYYPCLCRANKLAQLMRLHVVTPKAPVHCTLDPKVQPAPGAPIFISAVERPTKLTQSAYWVMRLPYVYVADKEHYPQHMGAKLLQGVFGVTEIE
jgi:protein SMG8